MYYFATMTQLLVEPMMYKYKYFPPGHEYGEVGDEKSESNDNPLLSIIFRTGITFLSWVRRKGHPSDHSHKQRRQRCLQQATFGIG